MPKIVPIVEGDGEVEALPILLRKLLGEKNRWDVQIARPKNANGRDNLTRNGGLERFLRYAWKEPDCAAILVLVDADEGCARHLAESLATRARALGTFFPVAIVCAKYEYEAWFLASLETVAGADLGSRPGLPVGLKFDGDVEALRGVKEWLSQQMPPGRIYKETFDQAPMTDRLDATLARERSRSFRRLCHAVEQIVPAVDRGTRAITP